MPPPEKVHASAILRDSLLHGGSVGDAIEEWRSDDLRKATNEDEGGGSSRTYVQSHGWRTREC